MIDILFKENPSAWFIGFFIVGLIIFLSVKYRFWLFLLKVIVVLLIGIVLLFVVEPFIYNLIFDPELIITYFWRITPNLWDDFYMEITFALELGLPLIIFLLLGLTIKGKKRASSKPKIRVDID